MSVADFGMVVTETELNPDPEKQSSGSGLQTSANSGSSRMDTIGDQPVAEETSQPSLPQTIAIQPNMSSVKIADVDVNAHFSHLHFESCLCLFTSESIW